MAACSSANSSGLAATPDEGLVHALDNLVDDYVFMLEPVDHRNQTGVGLAQVREDRPVLQAVMRSDHAAIGSAVSAERPVVLPQRHLLEHGARRPHRHAALLDL